MKKHELTAATGKKDTSEYKSKTYEVDEPENLDEAVVVWGKQKVFDLAIAQSRTDSINAVRNELKGKETGTLALGRSVAEAIKVARASGDAATIKALEDLLGVPLS